MYVTKPAEMAAIILDARGWGRGGWCRADNTCHYSCHPQVLYTGDDTTINTQTDLDPYRWLEHEGGRETVGSPDA